MTKLIRQYPLVFIAVAICLVYFPVVQYGLFDIDDRLYLKDSLVQGGLNHWTQFAWLTQFHLGNWHPLTSLSMMVEYEVFGLRTSIFHLNNLIIHTFAAFAAYFVCLRLVGNRAIALLISLGFAIHPLNVENVVWISERKSLLCQFFSLYTLHLYLKSNHQSINDRIPYHLTLMLALLSKPIAVTLPFILLLLDYSHLSRIKLELSNWKMGIHLVSEKWLMWLMVLGICWITLIAQTQAIDEGQTSVAHVVAGIGFYVSKTIFPTSLAFLYPYLEQPPVLWLAVGACFLFVLIYLLIRIRTTTPIIPLGALWFVGALLPIIGLVRIGGLHVANRYAYFPMIGLFIATFGSGLIFSEAHKKWRLPARTIALALVLWWMGLAIIQVRLWENPEDLYRASLKNTHQNATIAFNLGSVYLKKREFNRALEQFDLALQWRPDDKPVLYSHGVTLINMGHLEDGYKELVAAFIDSQNPSKSYCELGEHLLEFEQPALSYEAYSSAQEQTPLSTDDLLNWARAAELANLEPDSTINLRVAIEEHLINSNTSFDTQARLRSSLQNLERQVPAIQK